MDIKTITLGSCRIDLICEGATFVGLGSASIAGTVIRSGRLPIRPFTQSFSGLELAHLSLHSVSEARGEARIELRTSFRPLEVKILRDHSFDPIHNTRDWERAHEVIGGNLTIVIRSANRVFNGQAFDGFSYHYEYQCDDVPIFYLLDKSSWELDGDIVGATVYSQCSCSLPVAHIQPDTFFTTEGAFFFGDESPNPVMTHNLPRWASHQSFDFHFRGNNTLIGVFERVELIRSLLLRDPGKPELKCFDKHIFDEAKKFATSPKEILLNTSPKSVIDQQNLWTWISDDVDARARAEFGLREQPTFPLGGHHYWINQTADTYHRDVAPALCAIGNVGVFVENFKKSDRSQAGNGSAPNTVGNMCVSHEFEIAPTMGGVESVKALIDRFKKSGIESYMWTNSYISRAAGINDIPRHNAGWYIHMEDTRLKYGGAYTDVATNLNFKNEAARRYWIDAHIKLLKETGLDGFFIDSFYNLFFMPINYRTGHPQTMWREALSAMREVQDAGGGFYIESFGPFGQPQHGHPSSYNTPECAFICYKVGAGNDYATVPIPGRKPQEASTADALGLFFRLANKAATLPPLFVDGKRIDDILVDEHRRTLAEYRRLLPDMHTRYLQEDGLSVLWHDEGRSKATLWNFADRNVAAPGSVTNISTGETLPAARTYRVRAGHTYQIEASPLPKQIIVENVK